MDNIYDHMSISKDGCICLDVEHFIEGNIEGIVDMFEEDVVKALEKKGKVVV